MINQELDENSYVVILVDSKFTPKRGATNRQLLSAPALDRENILFNRKLLPSHLCRFRELIRRVIAQNSLDMLQFFCTLGCLFYPIHLQWWGARAMERMALCELSNGENAIRVEKESSGHVLTR